MRKLLLFALLFTTPSFIFSQDTFLQLRSGNYAIPSDKNFTQTGNLPSQAFFEGHYYVIGHFHQIPSQEAKAQLEAQKIKFLSYLPTGSYVLQIPDFLELSQLENAGLMSISAFHPDYKLQHELAAKTYPEYAQVGDLIQINFSVFKGISAQQVANLVNMKGISFEPILHYNRVYSAQVTEQQLADLAALPVVEYIEPIDPPAAPENLVGTTSHRSSYISNEFVNALPYNGDGVWVAMGDDGEIGPHIDYTGRTDQSNAGPDGGNHGDHIAGTIMGAGNLDPTTRGMAWGADLLVYDVWDAVNSAPTAHLNPGVMVTSTSYSNGCNAGYTNFARSMDEQISNLPELMHVFSAGNSGTSDCNYGAGSGWGNVTGGVKVAKNVIAVGNLTDQDQLAGSSSRGPAEDGRIKPEICAVGTNVYSTNAGNIYNQSTGTSMSAPGVSGTYAQLVQVYRELNSGANPSSALLKNALMNSADDLGNEGPDFKHGFGRLNARKAHAILANNFYFNGAISQGDVSNTTLTLPANVTELKIMVYWNDVEAATNASPALVNDIDLTVSSPQGSTIQPLVLDPTATVAALDAPAVPGVDRLNNMEQVVINQPNAGNYTINLEGFNIPFGPQEFYVTYYYETPEITVIYPRGGESVVPGVEELIRWDIEGANGNSTVELSTNGGASWSTLGTTTGNETTLSWTPSATVSGDALIRVSNGSLSDQSDAEFNIIGVPGNLTIDYICPDSLGLSWAAVNGATEYEVYKLGSKYMDPIDTVSTNSAVLYGLNPFETDWFSVRAIGNNALGRRAIAIEKPLGTVNCVLSSDLALQELISPSASGPLTVCQGLQALPIQLTVENLGQQTAANFAINYSLNGGATVSQTISTPISAGTTQTLSLSTPINVNTPGVYSIQVWSELIGDQNAFNDTLNVNFSVLATPSSTTFPIYEDFESFNLCSTANDCGATVCNLSGGWTNASNGLVDDIDWRTHAGSTPSNGTGPFFDFDPGTQAGKYIYLEASGGCTFQEAQLISPCIELVNIQAPELTFGYHMDGEAMGELHIDVLVNSEWVLDVIPPISADNGVNWSTAAVNLSPYLGEVINIRFRGVTGPDWQSDMALDGISIQESTSSPEVDFAASDQSICPNQVVTFYDLSTGAPSSLAWSISPSTGFTYVNGTNSTSFQPQVEFQQPGYYNVQLIGVNPNGSDTLLKNSYIEVSSGAVLPLVEDFEGTNFPPSTAWLLLNPDNLTTWQLDMSVAGSNSQATGAIYMDNYNYDAAGEEDILELPTLDLTQVNSATLTFDVAAAQYQSSSDQLKVELSLDCGETFTEVVYFKEGSVLATVNPQGNFFTPSGANDWRNESVDLSPYAGQSVVMRFVAVNDYGNTLYLDNINIQNTSVPVAQINGDGGCEGDVIVFEDNSQGVNLVSFQWDFGQDATPATATGAGPHSVSYATVGQKQVSLSISDGTQTDNTVKTISIDNEPIAGFTQVIIDPTTSAFVADYSGVSTWDFGDGSPTVTGDSVAHTYAVKGNYTVTQTITNACGTSEIAQLITVAPVSVNELNAENIRLYPNPTRDVITLELENVNDYTIVFTDLAGREVHTSLVSKSNQQASFSLSGLSQGVYLVVIQRDNGGQKVFRVNVIE